MFDVKKEFENLRKLKFSPRRQLSNVLGLKNGQNMDHKTIQNMKNSYLIGIFDFCCLFINFLSFFYQFHRIFVAKQKAVEIFGSWLIFSRLNGRFWLVHMESRVLCDFIVIFLRTREWSGRSRATFVRCNVGLVISSSIAWWCGICRRFQNFRYWLLLHVLAGTLVLRSKWVKRRNWHFETPSAHSFNLISINMSIMFVIK